MLKFWPAALLALVLSGCGEDAPPVARKTTAERKARAEVALSQTPVPRTYTIQGNQLQVIEVPVADASGFVDVQRCMVWRDQEFKTVTMSCGQQSDVLISGP